MRGLNTTHMLINSSDCCWTKLRHLEDKTATSGGFLLLTRGFVGLFGLLRENSVVVAF